MSNVKIVSANERAFFKLQNFIKLRKKEEKFVLMERIRTSSHDTKFNYSNLSTDAFFALSAKKFIVFIKITRSRKPKHDNGTRHVGGCCALVAGPKFIEKLYTISIKSI